MFSVILSLVPLVLVVACGVQALRRVRWQDLVRFGAAHAVVLDDDNVLFAMRGLARQRSVRSTGVLGMVVLGYSLPLVGIDVWPSGSMFGSALLGYVIGCGVAALVPAPAPAPGGAVRSAVLDARLPAQYLSRPTLVMAPTMLGLGVAAVLAPLFLAVRDDTDSRSAPARMAALAVGAAVAATALWIVRHVVARPQPAMLRSVVVVDDALRSDALHRVVGTAIAIVGFVVGSLMLEVAYQLDGSVARIVFTVLAVAVFLSAALGWGRRRAPWTVRRALPFSLGAVEVAAE